MGFYAPEWAQIYRIFMTVHIISNFLFTFDLISDAYNCYTGHQDIYEELNSKTHLCLLSTIFSGCEIKDG